MNHTTAEAKQLTTILDFLRFGLSQANRHALFYGHGTDNAWDDVRALVLGSLKLPFDIDSSLLSTQLTSSEREWLTTQLIKRIDERVPVPYLIKEAFFCGLPFYVDERVLIPRSPIAELINQQFSPWIAENQVHRILDLCTGSGCIAIACHYAFPDAHVDAVDLSSDALDVAAINCQRHHLTREQLTLIESDCWQRVPHERYDLIIANPPYVGEAEMNTLPVEYSHEPQMALQTTNNGLAIVETILQQAAQYLTEHGILIVEVGNSEHALTAAYPDVPFMWLEFEHGGSGVFLLTYNELKIYFG